MKIELKNIEFSERMSEETNCFVADIYVNNKKVGYAKNDGRGGSTCYNAYDGNNNILKEVEDYCLSLGIIKDEEFNYEYQMTLEHYIDNLLLKWLEKKEEKKMNKLFENSIVFGIKNSPVYSYISFKSKMKFKDIVKMYGENTAKIQIQSMVDSVKTNLKENEIIFNTNLEQFGIIL